MGRQSLDAWSKDIIELAGVPDNHSTRFCVAGMILHGTGEGNYSKYHFVKRLRKFAANEVAMAVTTEMKAKRDEALKAQNLGATPAFEVINNDKGRVS